MCSTAAAAAAAVLVDSFVASHDPTMTSWKGKRR